MQDQLGQLSELNTDVDRDCGFSVNALAKLKAVRTPPFHHRAVELVKKREKQMEVMMVEGAQLDMLRRENASLKEQIRGLEGLIETLRAKEGQMEKIV